MSDLHLVAMPKWGLSMEEGLVVAWHKQVGDAVAKGDDLIDVETTKITNTVEAPVAGVLLKMLAQSGETVTCGHPMAVIGPDDATGTDIDRFVTEIAARATRIAADFVSAIPEPAMATASGQGQTVRIRYLDIGTGPETLVLLHGFGGDLENWMFNQPALAVGNRVIAIDLPGHGGSDKRVGDGSALAMARIVGSLLDDIAPGRVHLVAHSFGAVVARELAAGRPDRVASVTAIAPADLGMVQRPYIDCFIAARRRSDLSAAIGMLFADPGLATREMAEALLRYKRLDGVDLALRTIDAANFGGDRPVPAAIAFWGQLGSAGQLIWGTGDSIVPQATSVSDFPGVSLHEISGAGHMPHLEKSDQVNALVAKHVAAHRCDPPPQGSAEESSATDRS